MPAQHRMQRALETSAFFHVVFRERLFHGRQDAFFHSTVCIHAVQVQLFLQRGKRVSQVKQGPFLSFTNAFESQLRATRAFRASISSSVPCRTRRTHRSAVDDVSQRRRLVHVSVEDVVHGEYVGVRWAAPFPLGDGEEMRRLGRHHDVLHAHAALQLFGVVHPHPTCTQAFVRARVLVERRQAEVLHGRALRQWHARQPRIAPEHHVLRILRPAIRIAFHRRRRRRRLVSCATKGGHWRSTRFANAPLRERRGSHPRGHETTYVGDVVNTLARGRASHRFPGSCRWCLVGFDATRIEGQGHVQTGGGRFDFRNCLCLWNKFCHYGCDPLLA